MLFSIIVIHKRMHFISTDNQVDYKSNRKSSKKKTYSSPNALKVLQKH